MIIWSLLKNLGFKLCRSFRQSNNSDVAKPSRVENSNRKSCYIDAHSGNIALLCPWERHLTLSSQQQRRFFVYLHEKHTKILDSNLEKTRPNRQITEKRKTHIYTKKNNEITIYFSHGIHGYFYSNKVLQFFT